MLQDVLTTNYPKYKHYYDVKVKSDTLPWWDNKNYFVDETREIDSTKDSTSINKTSTDGESGTRSQSEDISDSTNKFLDTPEGRVDNLDDGYMTNVTQDHGEDVSTSESNTTTSSDSTSDGKNSSKGKDLHKYHREEHGNVGVVTQGSIVNSWLKYAMINVDKIIFDDCESLFMQVY